MILLILAQAAPTDYSGLAAFATAVLTPLSVVLLAWFTHRKVAAVSVKVDNVAATADATLVKATSTDHAVNGKAPGAPTISEGVDTILEKQERDAPSDEDTPPDDDESNGEVAILPLVKNLVKQIAALRASFPNDHEWEPVPPKKKPPTRSRK